MRIDEDTLGELNTQKIAEWIEDAHKKIKFKNACKNLRNVQMKDWIELYSPQNDHVLDIWSVSYFEDLITKLKFETV